MAELSRADDAKVVLVKDASDIYAEYGMRPTHIDFLNGLGAYVHFESADDPQNEDARFLSELSEEQLARIGKEFLRMRAELKRRGMVTGDEHKFEENSQIKVSE
uniref:Uncharacterized protein n=1 Tax=Chromera velia CCMP2878 TaxID=1169474 RepID=A0A0G4G0I6_9ALVE|eukprot:Cvel_19645.t1-p1 / transcript=Cvel_19645.t1 / gene=Cvel_19645 / organism=Chromera_velia_CCMP2878 / gene_product=hypothetical protein / transcript_product=hypothetical protein / location=Cvel_scaffold1711:33314-34078(-) / protein_length=103 / sequence_SO=supercontig / SO=protein_coding / is_pseudo=false